MLTHVYSLFCFISKIKFIKSIIFFVHIDKLITKKWKYIKESYYFDFKQTVYKYRQF